MKRAFLKELGLEDDIVNQVMAEHGKTVQQQQDNIEQLNRELTETKTELSEAKNAKDNLTVELEQLEEVKAEREELQAKLRNANIETALIAKGGTDLDYLKFKLGDVDGDIDEAINQLKEDYPSFFQSDEPKKKETKGYEVLDRPLVKGDEPKGWTIESIMALDDAKQRQQLIRENPGLFRK